MRKQCSATKRVQSTTLKDARTNIIIALTTGYTKSSRQTQSQVAFVVVSDARCLTVEFHNTFLKQSCAHAVGIENMHHMATGEKCSARINIGIVNMRFGVAEKKIEKRRKKHSARPSIADDVKQHNNTKSILAHVVSRYRRHSTGAHVLSANNCGHANHAVRQRADGEGLGL